MNSIHEIYGGKLLSVKTVISGGLVGRPLRTESPYIYTPENEKDVRVCLKIVGVKRDLALNKTNAMRCAKEWGEDYTLWNDKPFKIEITKVDYMKEEVDGIKVIPMTDV